MRRSSFARAGPVRMPPMSIPAALTPFAIWSSCAESYAYTATVPRIRKASVAVRTTNERCLVTGSRMVGAPKYILSNTRVRAGQIRSCADETLARRRFAPCQNRVDGGEDSWSGPLRSRVVAEGQQVAALERVEQRDDLLRGEVVVVTHRSR